MAKHACAAEGPRDPRPPRLQSGFVPVSESEHPAALKHPFHLRAHLEDGPFCGVILVLFPTSPHRCEAEGTHLHEVENKDEDATPAVQAVQVRIALLPVVVEHRHQAWTRDEGSREDRLMGTGAGEVTQGKPD